MPSGLWCNPSCIWWWAGEIVVVVFVIFYVLPFAWRCMKSKRK